MVDSLAPTPLIKPHHAMRVLPSWGVAQLQMLGFSLHGAFLLLSSMAFALTGCLSYIFFRRTSQNTLACLAGSLLLLVPHWAMLIPLKTPYQASDAWVYVWTILTFYAVQKRAVHYLAIISVLGILTRQNCFLLGGVAYLYLWTVMPDKWIPLLYLGLITALYTGLSSFYGAKGALLHHITPSSEIFNGHFWWFFIQDSHVLSLFTALLPWIFLARKQVLSLAQRYWYAVLYASLVMAQPFFAYAFTGYHNFVRIALQGSWVIYFLIVGSVVSQKLTHWQTGVLLLYSLMLGGVWGDWPRLGMALIAGGAVWFVSRAASR